jgi:predicted secreted Zn-dependent protease
MARVILGIDFDPSSLESRITMPQWKQYGQAGPQTKAAWDAFIKALQTHEDGHRKIYNEQYRTPAKAEIEGLARKQVVVEAHLWPGDTLENLRKAGDKKLDGLVEDLDKKLKDLWKDYSDADKSYDKTTDHGKNQAAYPGYGPGDNIPVGEGPRPLEQ